MNYINTEFIIVFFSILKNIFSSIVIFTIFLLFSCSDHKQKYVKVFDESVKNSYPDAMRKPEIHFAIAPVLSSKSSLILYSPMLDYIEKHLNRKLEVTFPKSYLETNAAIENGTCDIAIVCTGAFLKGKKYMEVIVVPEISGKTFYNSYIIVNKESDIKDLSQLKNKVFAFTDPLSLSGFYYAAYRIKTMGYKISDFFEKIIWTKSHDLSIKNVGEGLVDGASVDSIVYDFLIKNKNEFALKTKVIEKSFDLGIPPVVVRSDLENNLKEQIQSIFLRMDTDNEGKKILQKIGIDRFVKPDMSIYNQTEKILRQLGEID